MEDKNHVKQNASRVKNNKVQKITKKVAFFFGKGFSDSSEAVMRVTSSFFLAIIYGAMIFSKTILFNFILFIISSISIIEGFDAIPKQWSTDNIKKWRIAIFAVMSLFYFALSSIRLSVSGVAMVFWIIALNATVDSAAYVSGKIFGRVKIVPNISPGKTVEGLIGGVFAGLILSIFFYSGVCKELQGITFMRFIALSIVMSLLSQLGDLMVSKMKRVFQVKDMGNLIPGHGGILDRIDSWILTTIFWFILIHIVQ